MLRGELESLYSSEEEEESTLCELPRQRGQVGGTIGEACLSSVGKRDFHDHGFHRRDESAMALTNGGVRWEEEGGRLGRESMLGKVLACAEKEASLIR